MLELQKVSSDYIAISGGEPFLFLDLLLHTIELAGKNNKFISINTNGYWGKNSTARNYIKLFRDAGLSRIKISTDRYHQAHLPIDIVCKAIDIALSESLLVDVTICYSVIEHELKTIGLLQQRFGENIHIRIQRIGRFGRSIKKIDANNCTVKLDRNSWCCKELNSPAIMPNGDMLACCGPPISDQLYNSKSENPYFLGNLFSSDITCILHEYRKTDWMQSMRNKNSDCRIKHQVFTSYNANCVCDYCLIYSNEMNLNK